MCRLADLRGYRKITAAFAVAANGYPGAVDEPRVPRRRFARYRCLNCGRPLLGWRSAQAHVG